VDVCKKLHSLERDISQTENYLYNDAMCKFFVTLFIAGTDGLSGSEEYTVFLNPYAVCRWILDQIAFLHTEQYR
jgi:hypothetical protein